MSSVDLIKQTKVSDVRFDPNMTEAEAERLAEIKAFERLDPKFPRTVLKRIIHVHGRVARCQTGDIVIRKGDWGNSAFFIISGSVVAEIEPPGRGLPDEVLGRRAIRRKTFLESLAQLWSNHRQAEYRDANSYNHQLQTATAASKGGQVGRRGGDDDARVYLQDIDGVINKYETNRMQAGDFFGEIGALGRTRRTATVFAEQVGESGLVELLEVRWQGLRDMMKGDRGAEIRKSIDETFRLRSLNDFLDASPILAHLNRIEKEKKEAIISELVREVELTTYGEFDQVSSFTDLAREGAAQNLQNEPLIAQEGDYPNGVVIIRSGVARLSKRRGHGHQTVSYLTPGKTYGFEEITEGFQTGSAVTLKHSLRAIGFLAAVVIPTALVEKHIISYLAPKTNSGEPHFPRSLARRSARKPFTPALAADRIRPSLLEFLVNNTFVNGTATMLIDLDRCTRCDDCVRACASTHDNNPRFVRHGPVRENVMVANACMHCQDPVCMIECPTGAISRRKEEKEITINDASCIGCASCANNCPYDAIRMVEIRNEEGAFIYNKDKNLPIVKATKCDLCVDQWGGPACQLACPHDALVRMDMSDIEELAAWHGARSPEKA